MAQSDSDFTIRLPSSNIQKDDEVLFKLQKKKVMEERVQKFRSFAIDLELGCLVMGAKRFPVARLYEILMQHGLSSTVPIAVSLNPVKMINIDWYPSSYAGPTVWHFQWSGIDCSVAGDNRSFGRICIRVHDMTIGTGERVMEEIGSELVKTWVNPTPQAFMNIYTTSRDLHGYKWIQHSTRAHRNINTIYIDKDVKDKLVRGITRFLSSSALYDMCGVTWKRVHLLHGPPGSGKCLGKDTPVLMYNGSVDKVQNIKIGDLLMGDDSSSRTVLSTTSGTDKLYRVTSSKGESYIVNEAHILCLKRDHISADELLGDVDRAGENILEISVENYLKLSIGTRAKYKGYKIGVEFPSAKVPFDPYLLGYWLGDGTSSATIVHPLQTKLYEENINTHTTNASKDGGYKYGASADTNGALPGSFGSKDDGRDQMLIFLEDHNLLNDKHIPQVFLTNSRDVRLRVLSGLLDSSGYLRDGFYEIVQKNEKLANDIIFLVRSLGFASYKRQVENIGAGAHYLITVSASTLLDIPTILYRQQHPLISSTPIPNGDALAFDITVEYIGEGKYYGFEIDGNGRFLLGDFTVTHNTSTVVALASMFQRHIAKLTITPDLNSQQLEALFQTVPDQAWMILEDADAFFPERTPSGSVDFSTIINLMDGITTKRGMVLFLTTNNKNKLDAAFVRPGRVDEVVEFKLPGMEELAEALRIMGSKYAHEHEEFLNTRGKKPMTIAELQKHLFECIMAEKDSIL